MDSLIILKLLPAPVSLFGAGEGFPWPFSLIPGGCFSRFLP